MPILFREKALEKLKSPERLNQLLKVTTPAGWLALVAVCLVVASTVVWGFYGRVDTKVSGMGIVIDPRGLFDIDATGDGEVISVMVDLGSQVTKGQIVATLIDPNLTKEIGSQESKLRELRSDFKVSSGLIEKEADTKRRTLVKQRFELNEQIGILKNRMAWLEKRIGTLSQLFDKGLVTDKVLADRRLEQDNTKLKVAIAHRSLSEVIAQEAALESRKFEQLSVKKREIDDVVRNIESLKKRKSTTTQVRSRVSGRVVATMAQEGQVVKEGQAVVSVQPQDRSPVLDFYVTAFKGKQIQPGMKIQFTPSTVKREEYGFMLGNVTEVSPFPVPPAALMKVLEDKELVETVLKRGPVISVRGEFRPDPKTASGFKWSSRKGSGVRITTGTLGKADVVVKEQPPRRTRHPHHQKVDGDVAPWENLVPLPTACLRSAGSPAPGLFGRLR
ncbi:NHLP bacteriocin system secretion protein [Thermodesulfobacteriota bacterium]